MFKSINYLQVGNAIQRKAFEAIEKLGVLRDLSEFNPVLCGTLPIGIDVTGSDLDIVMEIHDFQDFRDKTKSLYENLDSFVCKEKIIRGAPTIKVNFYFSGFEFELFGQPIPVEQQYAYRHMIIEYHLLNSHPNLRTEIIKLKQQGIKTEPAFAQILGLEGDPYEQLLSLGTKLGVI